jgi:hypothetical protein
MNNYSNNYDNLLILAPQNTLQPQPQPLDPSDPFHILRSGLKYPLLQQQQSTQEKFHIIFRGIRVLLHLKNILITY